MAKKVIDATWEERIAERIYNTLDPWDQAEGTPKDVIKQMRRDPYSLLEYLLDKVDGHDF